MVYLNTKWIVRAPRDLERMLNRLPIKVARLFESFITDLENEGPLEKMPTKENYGNYQN